MIIYINESEKNKLHLYATKYNQLQARLELTEETLAPDSKADIVLKVRLKDGTRKIIGYGMQANCGKNIRTTINCLLMQDRLEVNNVIHVDFMGYPNSVGTEGNLLFWQCVEDNKGRCMGSNVGHGHLDYYYFDGNRCTPDNTNQR